MTTMDEPARRLRHIAIIPDGNRRWAVKEDLPRAVAYEAGERTIFATTQACLDRGVEWLTFFLFSTENWERDTAEVNYLVGGDRSLLYRMMRRRAQEIHARNIRFRVIGERSSAVALNALEAVEETEELTRENTGLNLVMAINYGGRQELLRAARLAAQRRGTAYPWSVEDVGRHLDLPEMPDVDLLIRTSGDQRISNYLLWQLAYAELRFVEVLWPDFNDTHLDSCLQSFRLTERRFGR